MLTNIKINNFLSIKESELELSPSGLTVLIGANGSGKSNFVKALEFIAELGKGGLLRAIYNTGGREAILPKSIPKKDMRGSKTKIEYTLELPRPPKYYPKEAPCPAVAHSLEIKWISSTKYYVSQEALEYFEPITVARALRKGKEPKESGEKVPRRTDIEAEVNYLHSSLRVDRTKSRTCKFTPMPDFDEDNTRDYIYWLGFGPYLEKTAELRRPTGFKYFLKEVSKDYSSEKTESLIEGETVRIMDDSEHFWVFKNMLSQIKQYDLQLSELRKEQPTIGFKELGSLGQYLPATVRVIDTMPDSRSRIKETLTAIAPHILDYSLATLKTGKEYLEFIESKADRPVESWSTSDGTLRALAILVAIESARKNQIIIIEEPELCLHPWAIKYLMNHISNVIKEKQGNIQVILTTHSQQVLECVTSDQVVIISRTPTEGTKFIKLTDISPKARIDTGEVGRLWVKGLLGGVPTYEE